LLSPNRISDPGANWTVSSPRELALQIRLKAVEMIAPQGFGYLGQALSGAEQVAAIFAQARPGVDRLVCSPGHYIIAVFAAARVVGLLDDEDLATYGQNGSSLEAIGTERTPIVDYTCGSLGQGLSAAVGFALADRLNGNDRKSFVMVSDGEMQEGQLWEAAIFAAHNTLENVIVLLDANNSQVDGPVDSITTIEPIALKWASFGWNVVDIDGHDIDRVSAELEKARAASGKPTVIVCRTSTVHGIDAIPEDADGHFIKLPPELAAASVSELEKKLEALNA
jgi:transketolase